MEAYVWVAADDGSAMARGFPYLRSLSVVVWGCRFLIRAGVACMLHEPVERAFHLWQPPAMFRASSAAVRGGGVESSGRGIATSLPIRSLRGRSFSLAICSQRKNVTCVLSTGSCLPLAKDTS